MSKQTKATARLVLTAFVAGAAAPAAGADIGLEPGQRVRVTSAASDEKQVEGTLVRADGLVLVVQAESPKQLRGLLVELPVGLVTRLQVQHGTRSRVWTGAGFGALAGALVGAVAMGEPDVPADDPCHDVASWVDPCPYSGEQWATGALVMVAVTGIGALVGSRYRGPAWAEVPAPRARVSVVPFWGRRAGLAVTVAF